MKHSTVISRWVSMGAIVLAFVLTALTTSTVSAAVPSAQPPAAVARYTAPQPQAVAQKPSACANPWVSLTASEVPVTVWTQCTKPNLPPCVEQTKLSADCKILQGVLKDVITLWKPMTNLMGKPLPDMPKSATSTDDGNTSNDIDIYIVPSNGHIQREGREISFTSVKLGGQKAAAKAVPVGKNPDLVAPPNSDSGAIMLRKDRVGTRTGRAELIHEFFHILQFAHNARTGAECTANGFWFDEASAVWAETYFGALLDKKIPSDVYKSFFLNYQQSALGLPVSDPAIHMYESFIWPYYMQQERGADSIADAFSAMENAKTCQDVVNAVDAQVLFDTNMERFALRNLNSSIFGAVQPINPRYNTLDPAFPDNKMPFMPPAVALKANKKSVPALSQEVSVWALAATYRHYNVDKKVGQLVFTFDSLAANPNIDINAVVRVGTTWSVRKWTGQAKVTICRDSDPVDEIYLVIDDHQHRFETVPTDYEYNVKSVVDPCGCDAASVEKWQATFTFDYNVGKQGTLFGSNVTANVKRTGTYSLVLGNKDGDSTLVSWRAVDHKTGGNALVSDNSTSVPPTTGPTHTIAVTGSSNDSTLWSSAELHLNPQTCTFEYAAQTQTNSPDVTQTDSFSGTSTYDAYGYGGSNVHNITFNADSDGSFSGSRVVTALGDSTNPDDIDAFIFQENNAADTYWQLNGNNWGTATVTWKFTPVKP